MKWDAELYDSKHEFVSQYGRALVMEVNRNAGQRILDLGCGTGKLSGDLAKNGATVIGVDASEPMIEKAKLAHPQLEFHCMDATALPYENEFDTVFSNAVFHWISNQEALLLSVHRALKPGGLLICEFGGFRNTERILLAFQEEYEKTGEPFKNSFFYPTIKQYQSLLEYSGFEAEMVRDFDRPTPLADGEQGLRNWLTQFYDDSLSRLDEEQRQEVLSAVEERLRPILWKDEHWVADYRRIQVKAKKPES